MLWQLRNTDFSYFKIHTYCLSLKIKHSNIFSFFLFFFSLKYNKKQMLFSQNCLSFVIILGHFSKVNLNPHCQFTWINPWPRLCFATLPLASSMGKQGIHKLTLNVHIFCSSTLNAYKHNWGKDALGGLHNIIVSWAYTQIGIKYSGLKTAV